MLHWSLVYKEYRPTIKYIKDTNKFTEDALIRITLINSDATESDIAREFYLKDVVLIN